MFQPKMETHLKLQTKRILIEHQCRQQASPVIGNGTRSLSLKRGQPQLLKGNQVRLFLPRVFLKTPKRTCQSLSISAMSGIKLQVVAPLLIKEKPLGHTESNFYHRHAFEKRMKLWLKQRNNLKIGGKSTLLKLYQCLNASSAAKSTLSFLSCRISSSQRNIR